MKKGMILKRQDAEDFDLTDLTSFKNYAECNDLDISGIVEYPIELTIIEPQIFADFLKKMKQDVFLVNDNDIFVSDVMRNGKAFEILEKNDISIMHTELNMELKNMYSLYPEGMLESMKKEIYEQRTHNNESYHVAVIASQDIDIDHDNFLEHYLTEHHIDKVLALQMNEFHEVMIPELNQVIEDHNINQIIVFDEHLNSQELHEYIKLLEDEKSIDIKYKDDLQNEMKNTLAIQGMLIS